LPLPLPCASAGTLNAIAAALTIKISLLMACTPQSQLTVQHQRVVDAAVPFQPFGASNQVNCAADDPQWSPVFTKN
jgi:hypothetical protein